MKRIGIFGGTFDPPHKGHMAIAEHAHSQLHLDIIYFVPAFIPPHKVHLSSTTSKHRLKMLRLVIGGKKYYKVSPIELKRRGISYTVDTLKAFKKLYPESELVLIIGSDNLAQFKLWRSPKTILKLALLAVYRRKGLGQELKSRKISFHRIKGQLMQVSSTEIRKRIKKDAPISEFVDKSVRRYIKQHSLYSSSSRIRRKKHCNEINCKH